MHEGHHGILEDKKGHHDHKHAHGHDHKHGHGDHHHGPPAKAGPLGEGAWMKLVAGGVVAALVIGFLVWKLM